MLESVDSLKKISEFDSGIGLKRISFERITTRATRWGRREGRRRSLFTSLVQSTHTQDGTSFSRSSCVSLLSISSSQPRSFVPISLFLLSASILSTALSLSRPPPLDERLAKKRKVEVMNQSKGKGKDGAPSFSETLQRLSDESKAAGGEFELLSRRLAGISGSVLENGLSDWINIYSSSSIALHQLLSSRFGEDLNFNI